MPTLRVWDRSLVRIRFLKRRHLQAVEEVQMIATEIVEIVKDMPYEELLRKLKLLTMTYRRVICLMMEVWKHINSYDTTVISPTFQFTRSAVVLVYPLTCPLLVGGVRCCRLWCTSQFLRPAGQQFSHFGGACPQIQE